MNKIANKGISEKDYLDDWICWGLFLRNIELKKLNKLNKIIELNKLLKIIKWFKILYILFYIIYENVWFLK